MTSVQVSIADVANELVDKSGPEGHEFIYVDISSIDRKTKKIIETKILASDNAPSRAKQRLREGDVLVSMTRPNLNAVAMVPPSLEGSIGSTGFHVIRSNVVDPKLMYYLVQSRDFIDKMCEKVQGALYPAVRPKDITSYIFNLPSSLERQRKIVAKIEELFSELDNGIAALKTAREQLKVYRQAVLKHAFEGKLTAKWREENINKLESPEQLLARIQQEREARYQQQLDEWKAAVKAWEANGKEGKKPGKPSTPPETKPVSTSDFEIPSEWIVSELGSIAYESVLGKMLDKQKNIGEERPYLGNINVRWGTFKIDEVKTMKIEESEIARYSLVNGDLVICEGGEPGRCAVWSGEDGVIFIQKALHRVRFTESYLPKFAFYYLTYSVPLERVVKHFTGTTIKHLTGTGLNKVQLPVCSADEQNEIISIIESKLSEIDALDSELEVQLAKAETLRQSILKKAFSGKLVPQDPNDEPASELLARIRAEKSQQKTAAKPVRKITACKRGRKPGEVSA